MYINTELAVNVSPRWGDWATDLILAFSLTFLRGMFSSINPTTVLSQICQTDMFVFCYVI